MKLPFSPKLGKAKLLDEAGRTERARVDLHQYVHCYGHDLDTLSKQVRNFFVASQVHYNRLAYRDAIATCLGLDMRRPEHRDTLWDGAVEALNPRRADGDKWRTGQADIPLDDLRRYAAQLRLSRPDFEAPSLTDVLAPVRLGVTRTITYIRVMPSRGGKGSFPDAEDVPEDLEWCWKMLRRHVHYRNSKPPDLNQHALDAVADHFKGRLWVEPHEIGRLKRGIENAVSEPALIFWFWPFVIFKHATLCRIESRNHKTTNPHGAIWNANQPGFVELWEGTT